MRHGLRVSVAMLPRLLPFVSLLLLTSAAFSQTADPKLLIDQAVAAVGGKDKLLTLFRIGETYHFGSNPEPDAGKKRSSRTSVLQPPEFWWIGTKERADEPAKFDVWAWTLGVLVDAKTKVEVLPDLTDEGKTLFGLRVSETITPAMDLYFEKTTSLLARIDWRSDFYRFSDYREHDGVKYAAKTIIFKKVGGKPWFFHEVTSVERLKELPAGLVKAVPAKP